jgi:hypothetical protein
MTTGGCAALLPVLITGDEASTFHFIDCPGRRKATLWSFARQLVTLVFVSLRSKL